MIDVRELSVPGAAEAPPETVTEAPPRAKRRVPVWEPLAWGLASFPASLGAFVVGTAIDRRGNPFERHHPHVAIWVAAVVLAVAALGLGVRALVQGVRVGRQRSGWLAGLGWGQVVLALPATALGAITVLINAFGGFSRGRQLRARGRLQLPPLGRGTGWLTGGFDAVADPADARAVADRWRENGRTEHASVAAFARLSLDLLGLGAPAALLEAAQRDGLDEIHHAEACFSLARALDGRDVSPSDFPAAARARPRSRVRKLALAQLAVDSLVEGALHEGLSARVVGHLAKGCEDPAIRPMLAQIAADESRHAAHAWDVLDFCLAEGGLPVRGALAGAAAALPQTLESDQPPAARQGAWVRYGIHGDEVEAEAYARTRAAVVRRLEGLLAVEAPAA
ncbi:MAG TPA: ferritin-like domain-containing protein [Myxococcales bacterium]|nr:ferritin-like domain-containing protein [Myxococcales bacterium]